MGRGTCFSTVSPPITSSIARPKRMKLKLILGALAALLALGAVHVWVNVGVDNFRRDLRELFGGKREQLVVGFLPVT